MSVLLLIYHFKLVSDNFSVCCERVLLSLVYNKADFTEHNNTRWESQIENTRRKKGRVKRDMSQSLGKQDARGKVKSQAL